jgi:hypothetical protein
MKLRIFRKRKRESWEGRKREKLGEERERN